MPKKRTVAKAILLALLVVLGMIVSPVSATYQISPVPLSGDMISVGKVSNFSVDVSVDGDAVRMITVDIETGTVVNFTLTYGNGDTVDGWMEYSNAGPFQQHTQVSIGGDTQSYDYVGVQEIGRIDVVGYARNYTTDTEYTTGFLVYDTVFGITQGTLMSYYPVADLSNNVIYKFELAATTPVALTYYTDTRASVAEWATTSPFEIVNDWVMFASSIATLVYDLVTGLLSWLKFFFVDNLLMTVSLYLALTMAYSFGRAKNMEQGLRKFFKFQRTFFEFIISLWNYFIQIISSFRGIFRI